jgi:hypothetical protein
MPRGRAETELHEKAKGWRARAFDRFQLADPPPIPDPIRFSP